MGRNGGEKTYFFSTKDEVKECVKQHHERSNKQKENVSLPGVFETEKAAQEAVAAEIAKLEDDFGDYYNVAVDASFHTRNEEDLDAKMEDSFAAVEQSFIEVQNAATLNYVRDGKFVECSRCRSVINVECLSKDLFGEGVCVICAKHSDFQPAEHNPILDKIGKRKTITKKHLFGRAQRVRPLFKQPQYDNAVTRFREEIDKLVQRREEIEKMQPKNGVRYILVVSWMSGHK